MSFGIFAFVCVTSCICGHRLDKVVFVDWLMSNFGYKNVIKLLETKVTNTPNGVQIYMDNVPEKYFLMSVAMYIISQCKEMRFGVDGDFNDKMSGVDDALVPAFRAKKRKCFQLRFGQEL